MEHNEFDTIYHEHFSYFSMLTTVRILEAHGMRVFDVEELASHGGAPRVSACRIENQTHELMPSVRDLIAKEEQAGLASGEGYQSFARQVKRTKTALVGFLLDANKEGKAG